MPADTHCKRISNRSREADGIRGGLTDAELEKFVQSFPVERI